MSARDWRTPAPEGAIYICGACGRSAKVRTDMRDASCMMNAVLCSEASIRRNEAGRIIAADAWPTAAEGSQ